MKMNHGMAHQLALKALVDIEGSADYCRVLHRMTLVIQECYELGYGDGAIALAKIFKDSFKEMQL